MGGCCGILTNKDSIKYSNYELEQPCPNPRDLADYPLHSFKALLAKIKLKGCKKYRNVGIAINFGSHHEFDLKSKSVNESIARWEVYHDFDFKATELQLREEFMELTFLEQGKNYIGFLKINLYLLATGPYHQDFAVKLGKEKEARLSFNLKIAQRVEIKLKLREVQLYLNSKQFPGDTFAFNLKAIVQLQLRRSAIRLKKANCLTNLRQTTQKGSHLRNRADLSPIEPQQVVYIKRALEEYRRVIDIYVKHVQRSKQEEVVPQIKLTLSLDERELRPEGILMDEEW